MIGQRGACGKPDCFFFPVFVDLSKCNFTFRGPKSARECVNEAIRWTITKREEWEAWALNWLCAGQAHNPAARQEILKHSAECLAYISQMRPLD